MSSPRALAPDRLAALPLLLAAALLVAACNSVTITTGPSGGTSAAPSGGSGQPPGSAAPSGAASSGPSAAPSGGPSAEPSPAGSPEPGGSATPAPASACAGSAKNQDFFAEFAGLVTWDVYCPVLPQGWFVSAGSYRLAGIGRLEITYKGPGGVQLALQEGGFCTDGPTTCAPADTTLGSAAFGDRTGTLVSYGGNLVLYVDPGGSPAWQATGIGLDEATFRAYGAALVKVAQPVPTPGPTDGPGTGSSPSPSP